MKITFFLPRGVLGGFWEPKVGFGTSFGLHFGLKMAQKGDPKQNGKRAQKKQKEFQGISGDFRAFQGFPGPDRVPAECARPVLAACRHLHADFSGVCKISGALTRPASPASGRAPYSARYAGSRRPPCGKTCTPRSSKNGRMYVENKGPDVQKGVPGPPR